MVNRLFHFLNSSLIFSISGLLSQSSRSLSCQESLKLLNLSKKKRLERDESQLLSKNQHSWLKHFLVSSWRNWKQSFPTRDGPDTGSSLNQAPGYSFADYPHKGPILARNNLGLIFTEAQWLLGIHSY